MDCVSGDKTKFKEGFNFFFWKLDVGEEIICTFFYRRKGVTPMTPFIWDLKISQLPRPSVIFLFQVVGSQARILYSDQKGRVSIAVAINRAISEGKIKVCLFCLDMFW